MDLSLTNPGLAYPGQITDPSTGLPMQTMPHVQFFKNAAARLAVADQALQASDSAIHNAPLTIAPPTQNSVTDGGQDAQGNPLPPQVSASGGGPQLGAPDMPVLPKMFKPSFAQTNTTPEGLPAPINVGQSKLGKLLSVLASAGQGALAGWGQMNPAAGAAAARDIPVQRAQRAQALQAGTLENQQRQAQLNTMPLSIAERQSALQAQQAQTEKELHGVHSTVYQPDPNNPEGYVQQGIDSFGRPTGQGIPAVLPGFLKPHTQLVTIPNPQNPNGPPMYAEYDRLKHVVTDMTSGVVIPGAEKFVEGLVPKSSTNTSTSTTDLMGNTRTTNSRVTGPINSQQPLQRPGVLPTAPQRPNSSSAPPPSPQNASGQGTPKPTAPQGNPVFQLPADVEGKITASGLKPQEQQYVRGLLSYQGQMPSPRAKNYASTLATLTAIDPTFNAGNYDAIRKTLSDYTPGGKVGSQVLAFNTAMRHVGMLNDAVAALNNGQTQLGNKLGNAISVQLGKDPVTNFNTIKTYLGGELAKGFGGGIATDSSRAEAGAILSSIQSPQQLQGGLMKAVDLLRGKIGAQEDAYQSTVHRPISLLDGPAHQVLQKLGMEQAEQTVTFQDSKGRHWTIPASNLGAAKRRDPRLQIVQ